MAKICHLCGADVAQIKRIKDPLGHYYCVPCHTAAAAKVPATALPDAPAASVPPVAVTPSPELALVPDPYDLAELPAKKEPAKAACGVCKRLLPEQVVQFHDGESICRECLAKRSAKPSASKRLADKPAEEPADTSKRAEFMASSRGIPVTAAGTCAATWLIMTALIALTGIVDLSFLGDLLAGAVMVVYCAVLAGLLLVSMLIVDKIFGGLGFGTVSDVIWKSMLVAVISVTLSIFSGKSETFALLAYAISPGAMLVVFVVIFRLDFFEAVVLSVVNWLIGMAAKIFIGALLIGLVSHTHLPKEDDPSPFPPPTSIPAPAPLPGE